MISNAIDIEHTKLPVLYGLVLAGGKSIRMGRDKGTMIWHGKEQRYYMADLLASRCSSVFISCRPEQVAEIDAAYVPLPDIYTGLGPYGAILSAFHARRDVAWLVTACDLPLLDNTTIDFLVRHRNPAFIATTFKSPHDGLPEPLVTIWEPSSYPVLLSFMEKGYKCPRKVLINSEATLLEPSIPEALINANTAEEAEKVKAILSQRTVFNGE